MGGRKHFKTTLFKYENKQYKYLSYGRSRKPAGGSMTGWLDGKGVKRLLKNHMAVLEGEQYWTDNIS